MAPAGKTWKINTKIDPRFWEEIGHTRLDFPSAICELVDNAISATRPDAQGNCSFNILVKLVRFKASPSSLHVVVADDGLGIPREAIVEKVFSLGAESDTDGLCFPNLREHGFGLKHAIAWFVRDTPKREFDLVTACRSKLGEPAKFYRYTGPLQDDMELRESSRRDWAAVAPPMLKGKGNPDTGTRVSLDTSFESARAGWSERRIQLDPSEIQDCHALRNFLAEELGVRYRDFIGKSRSLRIACSDECLGDDVHRPIVSVVPPRQVPYLVSRIGLAKHKIGGVSVWYERGISNPDRVDPPAQHGPNAFRIYYGHSLRGQGIDVVLNGRVVEAPMYPWPDPPHNLNNGLVGELHIDGDVETILTKDRLDWTASKVLQRIKDEVLSADIVGPRGGRKSLNDLFRALVHAIPKQVRANAGPDLTDFLRNDRSVGSPAHIWPSQSKQGLGKRLKFYVPLNEAVRSSILSKGIHAALAVNVSSRDTWGVNGVPVLPADIVFDHAGQTVFVECKDRDGNHDDIYQVRRYWDGLAARGQDVKLAILVTDRTRPEVRALAEYLEAKGYVDERSRPIRIRFLTWGGLKIPSRIPSGKPAPGPDVKRIQKVLGALLASL